MLTVVPGPATACARRRDEISILLRNALTLLDNDSAAAATCLQRAADMLRDLTVDAPPLAGSLVPWQTRRVETYIHDHLAAPIRIRDVAVLVRLSTSYFSRAFRITFGVPFTQYVIHRRMEQAKHLMTSTTEPLSHIALTCGLADQAHLTRLFRQTMGVTPAAWRRRVQQEYPDQRPDPRADATATGEPQAA
ncbi:helix-turn-helix transcriptional regulator [Nitrospirillum amazonense]|uniref:AraC-like DNA-binding protein n=1 Tax=Nitrospirillum amazonense TaxID=28077 RepID=A0A560KD91_9PROT|nr:AraC family transcriptional regulator [Nitrospirillum amazonense]MDG3441593.1 AraC family transcriptional regulator [Nitrospirillum amazonense]TWB79914.1 AraC-like DNA-binding protein [Nitrospirillum amazonense]